MVIEGEVPNHPTKDTSAKELDLDAAPKFDHTMPFSIVIFGATGDLARKKLFPALYQVRQ